MNTHRARSCGLGRRATRQKGNQYAYSLTLAACRARAGREPRHRPRRNRRNRARVGGTVVFIHDQEPPNLQGPWVGNNLYATALVLEQHPYGCQIRDDKAAFVPRLCTGKPQIAKRSPLTVRFTYKPDAEWSDGKEVTAADFRATWQVFINPANNVISRTGWEDISERRRRQR